MLKILAGVLIIVFRRRLVKGSFESMEKLPRILRAGKERGLYELVYVLLGLLLAGMGAWQVLSPRVH